MEYHRKETEETSENGNTVLPIDEEEVIEDGTKKRGLWKNLISGCKVPSLKTVGELCEENICDVITFIRNLKPHFFREESATISGTR